MLHSEFVVSVYNKDLHSAWVTNIVSLVACKGLEALCMQRTYR